MSLPYHMATGWFGGMLPLAGDGAALSATSTTASVPDRVAVMTLVIGMLFLKETKDVTSPK